MSTEPASTIATLGAEIWAWRRSQQPASYDDLTRLTRPHPWRPDFSAAAVDRYRETEEAFRVRLDRIDPGGLAVSEAVDHRLLRSVLARVRWELDVVQGWQRDATFHLHQAFDPYYLRLLPRPPFTPERTADLLDALQQASRVLATATESLTRPDSSLARAALSMLDGLDSRLADSAAALAPHLAETDGAAVIAAAREAGEAAESFRHWIEQRLPETSPRVAVGRDAIVWFLRNVAVMTETPEELTVAARQEYHRAVAWETVRANRTTGTDLPPLPADAATQSVRQGECEDQVQAFYERHRLLSQPPGYGRYLTAPIPDYVAPLSFLGVTDDLTEEDRLDEDGISYILPPSPDLPYFAAANARDPRAGIVHEGVHYHQFVRSYRHPNPIRRRYYDSGPTEGLAFYNEEMMLQAGLFDDAPHTAAVIYNFAKLRALRVEVDMGLATGRFTLEDAIDYFRRKISLDRDTAFEETTFYVGTPGQAHTYQTGKLQILRLLSAAVEQQGSGFSLQAFHDVLWSNGNIPIALQRWEMLGLRDDLDAVDADPLTGAEPPVAD